MVYTHGVRCWLFVVCCTFHPMIICRFFFSLLLRFPRIFLRCRGVARNELHFLFPIQASDRVDVAILLFYQKHYDSLNIFVSNERPKKAIKKISNLSTKLKIKCHTGKTHDNNIHTQNAFDRNNTWKWQQNMCVWSEKNTRREKPLTEKKNVRCVCG